MIFVLLAHAVAAVLAPVLVHRMGPRAFWLLALVPLGAAGWATTQIADVTDGAVRIDERAWVSEFGLELSLRLDALSLLMVLVAGGVGAVVLAYCARYFNRETEGLARFAGVLVGFAGAMLGLVLADDLLLLYVFWELTTVLSFLLIGQQSDRDGARRAAMDALIVTTLGGLAMLVGAILVGEAAGTYRISELLAAPPEGTAVEIGVALLLVGAVSKSALVPFHFWLPGAMAAPTPVSAYLHAAAMVKAGVFLIALLAPAFSHLAVWRWSVLVLGVVTMVLGAVRALRQFDLKLLLAYGTVSQLGLLIVLVGAGTQGAALAGLAMLLAHALYKSTLFLVVGIIDHDTGTRDLRQLSGLGRARPRLTFIAVLAAASMAGLPPLAGFAAKESALDAFLHGDAIDTVTLVALLVGSALTVAYALRFLWGAFVDTSGVPPRRITPARLSFEGGPLLLTLTGLVLGPAMGGLDGLLGRYAMQLPDEGHPLHLGLWHGFGWPLLLSGVAIASGLALSAWVGVGVSRPGARELARRAGAWRVGPLKHVRDARHCYVSLVTLTERIAIRVARTTQTGSLPVYLMIILFVLIGLGTWTLVDGGSWPVDVHVWDGPGQGAVALLIIIGAVLAVRARRRLKAFIVVGVVGYAVGTLFVLQGAPDLALTQFLVETVSLVVVVLVLRRLPSHFTGTASRVRRRGVHIVLGVAVGAMMATLTILMSGAREAADLVTVSAGLIDAAHLAGGQNVVNVTLVDTRAWDTMGEIAVLVVAATGVTSLLFLRTEGTDSVLLRRHSRAEVRRRGAEARGGVWRVDRGIAPDRAPGPAPGARVPSAIRAAASGTSPLAVAKSPRGGAESARRARAWLVAEHTLAPERRTILLEVVVRLIFHTVLVLSIYLLLSGHDSPGGGFAGGIVAGLALTIRYLAGGRYELGEAAPVGAGLVIGLGLVIATGTGIGGAIFGDAVLDGGVWKVDIPVLGLLKVYSSTAFDIGVYLVVVGVVLDVLRSFGSEIDRQVDEEQHAGGGSR
ncbi:MAG: Na+/H+ antiporter subunit A [Solirubrobacteraceae bacterium]|nr:Na+/H+ antiporter subunit A [Solirubrobacteraceae bacterium]